MSTPAPEPSIVVTMSETITYRRRFTVAELAALLDVDVDAVRAALDTDNANYGLAREDDETLLDAMVPLGDSNRYVTAVEDRRWDFA